MTRNVSCYETIGDALRCWMLYRVFHVKILVLSCSQYNRPLQIVILVQLRLTSSAFQLWIDDAHLYNNQGLLMFLIP